jgi:hypothetical protein
MSRVPGRNGLWHLSHVVTTDPPPSSCIHVQDVLSGGGVTMLGHHRVLSRTAFLEYRSLVQERTGLLIPWPERTRGRCGCDVPIGHVRTRLGELVPFQMPESNRRSA